MNDWLTTRLEPPRSPVRPARDDTIEGLRGAAALAVIYAHLTAPWAALDPVYVPPLFLWRLDVSGLAVMLFFMLSGYVIGLTNQRAISAVTTREYLRRRVRRILPIYFVAVILGWLARPGPTTADLVGGFFFLQNEAPDNPFHTALLFGNANLWSLHYEVVYYLLFILVWWLRPRALPVFATMLLLAALGVFWPGMSLWSAWLACGFVFWLAGLFIAWRLPIAEVRITTAWPSAILLGIATWRMNVLGSVLARLGWHVVWLPGALFTYLDSLPVLFCLFLLITRRETRWQSTLELFAWGWPAAYLGWRLIVQGSFAWQDEIVFTGALWIMALALRGWKPPVTHWHRLAPIGAISYGLYAFGAPIQFMVHALFPSWSGRWWTYGARTLIALLGTFCLAWLFERRFFFRSRAHA